MKTFTIIQIQSSYFCLRANLPGSFKIYDLLEALVKNFTFAMRCSAALLVSCGAAAAADLPSRKAAPVEYVRVCTGYGAGFFYIPGSDTCLRIGGRVRAEGRYLQTFNRGQDTTGFRARGTLNFDTRTATAYGTLRTFLRYEITRNGGNYAGLATGQTVFTPISTQGFTQTVDLNKAFIQFGPITAGRTTSFFDFYANALNWGGAMGSDTYGFDPVVFAYTANFGSGFSATLSAEEPTSRRLAGTGVFPVGTSAIAYGGSRMPDIVANVNLTQGWGAAQLSAAVHEINKPLSASNQGTEYGYAIQAGVKLNLPMLAAGDVLWLQAAYADGALSYLGISNSSSARQLGGLGFLQTDAAVDAAGRVKTTTGYSLTAAYSHYWTPTIRQAVFANYTKLDYSPSVESPLVNGARGTLAGYTADTSIIQAGSNLTWSPVAGLDLGVEVLYRRIDPRGRVVDFNRSVAGLTFVKGSQDIFEGRLRMQRDF